MPWKVQPVSELRLSLCHAVRSLHLPVAHAARAAGVSRKTAHKWLKVFDRNEQACHRDPALLALADRNRRPRSSPAKTVPAIEQSVLDVRDRRNWGPRKIHAFLLQEAHRRGEPEPELPSIRTVASILARNARIATPTPTPELQRFERDTPNALWQVDFKGPVEVARHKLMPFSTIDDHSRYLLTFEPCKDVTMASAWAVLWNAFAEAGLPEQILCDNAFSTTGTIHPAGISWFDARLIRLCIRPSHGRPYHPQTQGKVERMHGSSVRELIDFDARRDSEENFRKDCLRWRTDYNTIRPHEALGDQPPASRWTPSPRRRPDTLPEPRSFYPAGNAASLRTVDAAGRISFRGYNILCGRGIATHQVRVEERDSELAVFYCWKEFRTISHDQLVKGTTL